MSAALKIGTNGVGCGVAIVGLVEAARREDFGLLKSTATGDACGVISASSDYGVVLQIANAGEAIDVHAGCDVRVCRRFTGVEEGGQQKGHH